MPDVENQQHPGRCVPFHEPCGYVEMSVDTITFNIFHGIKEPLPFERLFGLLAISSRVKSARLNWPLPMLGPDGKDRFR